MSSSLRAVSRTLTLGAALALVGTLFGALATTLVDPVRAARVLGRLRLWRAGYRRAAIAGPHGPLVLWARGEGPRAVVLVHGFGESATGWAGVATHLARHGRVVVPDLPGAGLSAPRAGDRLSVDDLVDGLAAVVDREDGPVVLVGHSLGGLVAARLALRRPDRVAALVLVHAVGLSPARDAGLIVPSDRAEARAMIARLVPGGRAHVPGPMADGLRRHFDQPRLRALHADTLAAPPLVDDLTIAGVPVHLAWSADDALFPLRVAQDAAARIPGARLHHLPDAGHLAPALRPGAVAAVIREARGLP